MIVLNDMMEDVNRRMRDLKDDTGTDCDIEDPNPHIIDSKIQYVFDLFWIPDDFAWDLENGGNQGPQGWTCPSLLSANYNNHLETVLTSNNIPDGIDVFFPMVGSQFDIFLNTGNGNGLELEDCSQFPSFSNFDQTSQVQMVDEFFAFLIEESLPSPDIQGWTLDHSRTIAHELGHSFRLSHEYCDPITGKNIMSTNLWPLERNSLKPVEQVGRMQRMLAVSSVRRFVCCEPPTDNTLVIDSDETIDVNYKVYESLVVKSGATLTITCKLFMPQNGTITVEPGAKLIVDGGEITKSVNCNRWAGIRVEGNKNQPQTNQFHGIVELKNDAIIEHATVGVMLGFKKNGGGIIQVDDASIRNCYEGVRFYPYKNINPSTGMEENNVSYFKKCNFINNAENTQLLFNAQLIMAQVRGIEIRGCNFENTQTYPSGTALSIIGNGIESMDANYKVSILCDDPNQSPCPGSMSTPTKFIGFNRAIDAANIQTINDYSVYKAEFTNNLIGIYSSTVNHPRIIKNTFNIGGFVNPSSTSHNHEGVIINTGTGFVIEENDFYGTNFNQSAPRTGLRIFDSGEDANEVYKNTFHNNLLVSCAAHGQNKSLVPFAITGLQYRCNENVAMSNTWINFFVTDEGINELQGSQAEAAGNTFSLNANNSSSDYYNTIHLYNKY